MGTWYRQGTVSVVNGSKAVTGALTAWTANTKPGDGITFDDGAKWYEVDSVDGNTGLQLKTDFAETTISGGPYAIDQSSPKWTLASELAVQVAALLGSIVGVFSGSGAPSNDLGSEGSIYIDTTGNRIHIRGPSSWGSGTPLVGHGAGLNWLFDSNTTTSVDPGTGDVRINNSALASVTEIAISERCGESGNPSVAGWLNTFDDSTSITFKGTTSAISYRATAPATSAC